MEKVIVTGAGGFVGRWLLMELNRKGIQTAAVVRDMNADLSELRSLSNVDIVCCDMSELSELPALLKSDYDTFYHLAWAGSTGDMRGDYKIQLENVRWTCQAVEVAHRIGCKRFIGAGTLAELDVNAYVAKDDSKPDMTSNYGTAKIAAHYMSRAICWSLGIEHIWAYLSNLYGEGNNGSNFINFAVRRMLAGKDANFTSGEQLYDFVYISDAVKALVLLGEKGKANCSYYIGSNASKKLKYYIMQIKDAVDSSIQLHLGAVPFHGVEHDQKVFDCKKLMDDTGYNPEVLFEDGIKRTIAWLRGQMKGKK